MKKLRLELDALEVQSFSTLAGEKERGTVKGQWGSDYPYSGCCPQSASVPVACICASMEHEGTCDTTCNPNDCYSCNGGVSCPGCESDNLNC
jgi:hypothetical protein